MFYRFIPSVGSLMSFLCLCCVTCDSSCQHQPVFTPSRLVVKYGGAAAAVCTVCKDGCGGAGLEISVGTSEKNGSTLLWRVTNITEWDIGPICFFEMNGNQCLSSLPVTVYQPPQSVSISVVNHTGPLSECGEYTLQCMVGNVAPAENLTVTFYRGATPLGHRKSTHSKEKKPRSETFALSFSPSRYDDEAQLWCEARLDLGPEGPQPPPVVKSENLTAAVSYSVCPDKPVFSPSRLVVKHGDPASATCSSSTDNCQDQFLHLNVTLGKVTKTGPKLSWSIAHMTEWDPQNICYFGLEDNLCYSTLPVTVYQPPQSVSISLQLQPGPRAECGEHTLQCTVLNAAPVEDLTVTLYRGLIPLGRLSSNRTIKTPANETFSLRFDTRKEDFEAQFWCEAEMDLGPEGPQPPPVVKSQKFIPAFDCWKSRFGPTDDAVSVSHQTFLLCFMPLISLCLSSAT